MFNIEMLWEAKNQKKAILDQIEKMIRENFITREYYGSDTEKLIKKEIKKYESMTEGQLISIVNLFNNVLENK